MTRKPDDPHDRRVEPAAEEEPADPSRKERVLHTRVPAVLESELKRLATSLRIPVSNLVRAILEDAIDAADLVGKKAEGGLRGWAEHLAEERDRLRARVGIEATPKTREVDPLEGLIGFQPILLAAPAVCAVSGKKLAPGTEAFLGIRDGAGPRVIVSREHLPGHDDAGETRPRSKKE